MILDAAVTSALVSTLNWGRAKHKPGDGCPAKTAICHKCKRKGHYSAQCFSKDVAVLPMKEKDSKMQYS